jgi:hypothetical protein
MYFTHSVLCELQGAKRFVILHKKQTESCEKKQSIVNLIYSFAFEQIAVLIRFLLPNFGPWLICFSLY